jgi:hypothetical protein
MSTHLYHGHRLNREHLLDIVKNQQHVPMGEIAAQVVHQRRAARVLQSDAARDCRRHQRRIPHRGQRHEVHPVGKVPRRPARQLDRQPRLATAARPGQRQQARAVQQAARLRQLALPAHETRRRSWQHARSSHLDSTQSSAARSAVQEPFTGPLHHGARSAAGGPDPHHGLRRRLQPGLPFARSRVEVESPQACMPPP